MKSKPIFLKALDIVYGEIINIEANNWDVSDVDCCTDYVYGKNFIYPPQKRCTIVSIFKRFGGFWEFLDIQQKTISFGGSPLPLRRRFHLGGTASVALNNLNKVSPAVVNTRLGDPEQSKSPCACVFRRHLERSKTVLLRNDFRWGVIKILAKWPPGVAVGLFPAPWRSWHDTRTLQAW